MRLPLSSDGQAGDATRTFRPMARSAILGLESSAAEAFAAAKAATGRIGSWLRGMAGEGEDGERDTEAAPAFGARALEQRLDEATTEAMRRLVAAAGEAGATHLRDVDVTVGFIPLGVSALAESSGGLSALIHATAHGIAVFERPGADPAPPVPGEQP